MSADTETLTHCPWPSCGLPLRARNRLTADKRWCGSCQRRWKRAECPPSGPPAPQVNGAAYRQARSDQRVAQEKRACELAAQGLTHGEIADCLRLNIRTIRRYVQSQKQGGDVSDLRSDVALSRLRTREVKEGPEPVELSLLRHGHDQDPDEQSLLRDAVIDQRRREAEALLGGLTSRR